MENNTRLHTFGVGSGADERLIKGCAFAGLGNFSFIYNTEEIEQKVVESLSKTKLEYLLVTQARILDEDENVIDEMSDLPKPIQPGTLFDYRILLENKPRATLFQVKIYDPNQRTTKEFSRPIKMTESVGMFNSVVLETLNRSAPDVKIEKSVKHNVLCNLTSLIAFERIA